MNNRRVISHFERRKSKMVKFDKDGNNVYRSPDYLKNLKVLKKRYASDDAYRSKKIQLRREYYKNNRSKVIECNMKYKKKYPEKQRNWIKRFYYRNQLAMLMYFQFYCLSNKQTLE